MENVLHSRQTVRRSCHDWIKAQREKMGYKPAKQKPMEELKTIHIKTPKKEIKKRKKMEDDAIRHRMYELFNSYSNRIQDMLLNMSYDDMVKWIVNMEKSIEEANSFH